jgi:para-aminobenzoate synthetase / 4-amino-4-deoxychorismate lyase
MISPDEPFALFDADGGGALLLSDYQRTLEFDGSGELAPFFAQLEAITSGGEWVALVADYALGALFEPAIFEATIAARPSTQPLLRAWVFARSTNLNAKAIDGYLAERLALLPEYQRTAGIADRTPALEFSPYALAVERIRQWISDGDCYQINFTFPFDFQLYGHPLALYANLRQRQPVRYGGYLAAPEETLLSFSPELFFERYGKRVLARPMKGTAARGATPSADAAARAALLASEKERAENIMIIDLLRNDLGRLAAPGKVRVEVLCAAEAYPGLWQMVSSISAELPEVSLFDLFRALYPCGSITGAPKIQAMRRIAELESSARGRYTGAFGWLAPDGDCRFNVAIRTLEIKTPVSGALRRAKLGVGSGIVIDADPACEYAECLLKAGFLTGFDPGFELIETLRLEDGEYRLLALHLVRLAASARSLGFACDISAVKAKLSSEALRCPSGVHRVRLSVSHAGVLHLTEALLPRDERCDWRVIFSAETLAADDFLLRHKTSARHRYDRTLAALSDRPHVFDAIFLNARGEVCEGARSNLFIERDGTLLTPPLACGLLPGVMRQHLLDAGRAVERVLSTADVRAAPQLYMANALRGLLPVTLEV